MSSASIKSKVQKLLAKAASTEGTPESDIFYDKAFELMARHGLSESELPGAEPQSMDRLTVTFTGAYTDMQMQLLNNLAYALHCACVAVRKYRGVRVSAATVYGAKRHLERVELLYHLLRPNMLALAVDHAPGGEGATVARRRSFMQGFAAGIHRRLREAEDSVARDEPGYAVQLRDESQRAEDYMRKMLAQEQVSVKDYRSKRKLDARSYASGGQAAQRTDIGQTRVDTRRALPA